MALQPPVLPAVRGNLVMIDNTATEVRSTALAIMQDYFDPSKKVIDKRALYYAIVRALTEARTERRQEMA